MVNGVALNEDMSFGELGLLRGVGNGCLKLLKTHSFLAPSLTVCVLMCVIGVIYTDFSKEN